MLLYLAVSMSVSIVSENAVALAGMSNIIYTRPVLAGDTLSVKVTLLSVGIPHPTSFVRASGVKYFILY
jgi:acyl dehydratase